jgi:hypothetical protein
VSVDTCPWTSRFSRSSRLGAIRGWCEVRSRSYASFRAGPSAGDHDVCCRGGFVVPLMRFGPLQHSRIARSTYLGLASPDTFRLQGFSPS